MVVAQKQDWGGDDVEGEMYATVIVCGCRASEQVEGIT